ncbi:MAG: alpha-1,2-fucosyltransferase [Thermodesulfovibrionales bacterium]
MSQQLFVIAMRCGRLANRLILFANFVAFAEEHRHRLSNVTFHSYFHSFETLRKDIYCRYPAPLKKSRFDNLPGATGVIRVTRIFYHAVRTAARLNEKIRLFGRKALTLREIPDREVTLLNDPVIVDKLSTARVIFVYGWRFRAPGLVRKHAEKIRAYFRPVEGIVQSVDETVQQIRKQADIIVGVHIRRGDYRSWMQGRYFFDISHYYAWMLEMAGLFPDRKVCFFISSDEPPSKNEFNGLTVKIAAGPAVNDLYTLSQCDFLIGPPSTFSQWASFYGNKPLLHLRKKDERISLENFHVSFFENIP